MKKLFIGFILIINFVGISQDQNNLKAFDSVYYEIAVNISSNNPTKAMHLADSLYTYSISDNQRIKSLMLSADVLEKQEQRMEAIEYAQKAIKIAEDSQDYSFQARIYGFMSTQYRQLGFSDKGKEFIQKGLEVSSKMENKRQVTKYQAMANHELADYALSENDNKKAIEYINLALLGYQKEENPRLKSFQVANAKQVLGRCYIALGDDEQAFDNFAEANILINESEAGNTIWAAMIYQGFGDINLQKKQLDSAEVYLKKGLIISEESNNGSLKELLYESMSKYYKETGKLDSSAIYATKYREISKENKSKKNQMVNSEINRITKISDEKANNTNLYFGISVVLGLGVISMIYFFRRKKQTIISTEDIKDESNKSSGTLISLRTEDELVKKLKEFEASETFLDQNMSFSVLVGYLSTNGKYLNHILKKKKQKDFNTYINDLRIEYIVEKLKSDPEYLSYKVSYLAEISGFSSHSNFSANFRRVMQFSPSEFIESINHTA